MKAFEEFSEADKGLRAEIKKLKGGMADRELAKVEKTEGKKLRDAQRTGRASIVIDDVLPPWQPRMIEVRGTAAVVPSGGKAFGDRFEDTIVRIRPTRIISIGIESGEMTTSARSVSAT